MISSGCTARVLGMKRECVHSLHHHLRAYWLCSLANIASAINDLSIDHTEFALVELAEIYAEVASSVYRVPDFESAYGRFVERARTAGAESPAAVAACFQREIACVLNERPAEAREEDSAARLTRRVAQVIEQRYGDRLTVKTIARDIGECVPRMRSVFRREAGVPLWQYVTAVRVRRAQGLLLSGEKVEAVALMVGYTSKRQFLRQFQKHTGMSPARFRARMETPAAMQRGAVR